jgi:hypothetical protein
VRFGMLSKERVSAEARPGLAGFQHPCRLTPSRARDQHANPSRIASSHSVQSATTSHFFACGRIWPECAHD